MIMGTLRDIIKYNGQWYTEITSNKHRDQVDSLCEMLDPLKKDILSHNKADINITEEGIVINHLPNEIAERIRQINGRVLT
jgi:hypothetical protein